MRLIRYRKPSLKTALGVTRAKRRLLTSTGYYHATRLMRAPRNAQRRALRHVGYYSQGATLGRFLLRLFK